MWPHFRCNPKKIILNAKWLLFWSKLKDLSNIDNYLVIYKMSFTNLVSVVRGQNAIMVATYVQTHGRTYLWVKGLKKQLSFLKTYIYISVIFLTTNFPSSAGYLSNCVPCPTLLNNVNANYTGLVCGPNNTGKDFNPGKESGWFYHRYFICSC